VYKENNQPDQGNRKRKRKKGEKERKDKKIAPN
jgi:hypothetical protein